MIITPETLKSLMTGFRAEFEQAKAKAEPSWDKVATRVPSTSKSNTYGWLGQFPRLQEWVGDRQVKDMQAHGYQIENKLFESTVGVQRTDIEDDNLGVYTPMMQEMGYSAAIHPDELVFELLKDAHNQECYDGQNFFDDEHPIYPNVDGTGDPNLVSNQSVPETDPGPAWFLLDISRALKPLIFQERVPADLQAMTDPDHHTVFTKDEYQYGIRSRSNAGFGFWQMAHRSQQPLTKENYGKARQAMMELKADGGRPLGIRPGLLVVPPALEGQALEVLEAERMANGATNIYRNTAELLVTPWVQ